MKKKVIDIQEQVDGFYVSEVERGFWGEQEEGRIVLECMGIDTDKMPFSTSTFLKNGNAKWKDAYGNYASISFVITEDQIECFGYYLGNKKSLRVFREWSDIEEPEMVARLESEAIGNLCMTCLYDKLSNR